MENNEIYEKLLKKYTLNKQYVVAIEELAELQKELTKALRSKGDIDHTAEEIADVEIMLELADERSAIQITELKKEIEHLKSKLEKIQEVLQENCTQCFSIDNFTKPDDCGICEWARILKIIEDKNNVGNE